MSKIIFETPPEDFSSKVEVVTCFCQVGETFLLLQRNEDKLVGGMWSLPGGKVDPGETLEQAVVRELLEETGIVAKDPEFKMTRYVRGDVLDFVLHIFVVRLPKNPEKIVLCKDEHQDFKWVTPKEALEMNLVPGSKEYIALVYG